MRLRPACLRLSALLLAVGAAGCDSLPDEDDGRGDLVERLDRRREFTVLSEGLRTTGAEAVLRDGSAHTVLAPTDVAFEYLGGGFLDALLRTTDGTLGRALRHHVIAGRLGPDDFVDGDTLRSVDGRPLPVRRVGPVVQVGGVTIDVAEPLEAEGSVAYPAADVILGALTVRERLSLSPSLSEFETAALRTGLLDRVDALPSATVLAPIDDAFAAIEGTAAQLRRSVNDDVLRRTTALHVVAGEPALAEGRWTSLDGDPLEVRREDGAWTVGGREVLRSEELADGRLLVLGGVILEPLSLAERLRIDPATQLFWEDVRDDLPELWARLNDDDDELTVFVPNTFAYGLRGNLLNEELTREANRELNRRLLTVHVVEGELGPSELTNGRELESLEGKPIRVFIVDGVTSIDGRLLDSVPTENVRRASNGAYYTIGGFVFPEVGLIDTFILQGYTRHANAIRATGLEDRFSAPGITVFVTRNPFYAADPRLGLDPAPYLLYNATEASIPTLTEQGATFTALDGSTRTILYEEVARGESCSDGPEPPDPDIEVDDTCSPYRFQRDLAQIYQGEGALDGTASYHLLRSVSYPPGY